jgi:hypothetical protein
MPSKTNLRNELDDARTNLLTLAKENGESLASLSSMLGRNPAYLQQYVRRGTPKKLPEEIRHGLARLLNVEDSELGGSAHGTVYPLPDRVNVKDFKRLRGFAVRLESARQRAGYYSQSRFAQDTGIPLERYVVLERGDDDPTIAELDTISASAGISLNWLVKG